MPVADQLDVSTPDRVALQLPLAGIGYRTLSWLTDAALMFSFWIVTYFGASFLTNVWEDFKALAGLGQMLAVFGLFAAQWAYWTLWEIFGNGQTPGKRLLRIRVVSTDGTPVTPLQSVLRNLFRFVDFLPAFYATGVITMLASKDHRRVGDLVAGTLLVRDEKVDLSRYAIAEVQYPAAAPVLSVALMAEEHELLLAYLSRAQTLEPTARARLAKKFVQHYGRGANPEIRERALQSTELSEAFLQGLSQAQARA